MLSAGIGCSARSAQPTVAGIGYSVQPIV
ncbi:hypothetical protein A2U01_0117596 [Trifolium medium]|uniref:Uncharacterized protein n=1 Tax=Trifolium medium TaxID=97028 RepID=A0A392W7L8_9FABA|nr:hypothetical protein [Trifolium medium]